MNLFDILGPVMVGPSSSHTAGAVRMGYMAKQLLGEKAYDATVSLHGSFATTGVGHGTDKAIIAGILGMRPDDERIPHSFEIAKEAKLNYEFKNVILKDAHPNTAIIRLVGNSNKPVEVEAASIGGGRIMIHKLDGITVNFSGEKPTLIVYNEDAPGHVARVTGVLSYNKINIATMQLYREKRGGNAVMVIEMDRHVPNETISYLETLEGITKVIYVNTEE